MKPGTLVKYSKPEAGEESSVFLVVEDNGDRVFIEDYLNPATLKPVELVAREDVVEVVLPDFIAESFVATLESDLGAEKMQAVADLNRTDGLNSPACHTHDFCDANEVMASAFVTANLPCPTQDETTINNYRLLVLWGAAWNRAKTIISEKYPEVSK